MHNAVCIPIYIIDILLYRYRLQNLWCISQKPKAKKSKHEGRVPVLLWKKSCSAFPLLAAAAQHRLTLCENPLLAVLVAGELPQELLLRVEVTERSEVQRGWSHHGMSRFCHPKLRLGHRQGCSISFPSPCGTARLCCCMRGWCWFQICARGLWTAGEVSCRAGTGKWLYFCQITQSCDTLRASSVLLCQIDASWGMADNSWCGTKYKRCREMIPDPGKILLEQCGLINVF